MLAVVNPGRTRLPPPRFFPAPSFLTFFLFFTPLFRINLSISSIIGTFVTLGPPKILLIGGLVTLGLARDFTLDPPLNVKTVKVQFNSTKTTYCLQYIIPSIEQESCTVTVQEKQDTNKSLITVYPGSIGRGRASVSYITWEKICTFSRENFNLTVIMEFMLLNNIDLLRLPC